MRSRQWQWVASALVLLVSAASAEEGVTVYRCRLDEPVATMPGPRAAHSAADLAALQAWDRFAVTTVARAVQGQVRLQDALPLFSALAATGPFAGVFAGADADVPPALWERGLRFLDAAARLSAAPPPDLLRPLLADSALVAALRQDPSSAAEGAARHVVAAYFHEPAEGLMRFLPALRPGSPPLGDAEVLQRALEALDRGEAAGDLAHWLARTVLWDLRLYLLAKGDTAAAAAQAAALGDAALVADWRQMLAAAHLRHYLLGPREEPGAAARWAALEAERFVRERPDWAWVGQAAALGRELRVGTLLELAGPAQAEVAQEGSAALAYTAGPAAGATYATPALVWPRSVAKAYDGVRCLSDTAATLGPGPVSGTPQPAGLRFALAFTRPGTVTLQFQYTLYGLVLPTVSHAVTVVDAGGPAAGGLRVAGTQPAPLAGYAPTPGREGAREVLRRVTTLGGGDHAVETEIACEVVTGPAAALPADLDPAADGAVRDTVLAALSAAGSTLAGAAPAGAVRVAWAGGRGQDGAQATCYVLARAAQWLCRRGDRAGAPVWERLTETATEGWPPVQDDGGRLAQDVAACARATADALRGNAAPAPPGAPPTPGAWLEAAREWLAEDDRLTSALQSTAAEVTQGKLASEEAARRVGQELAAGWARLGEAAARPVPAELTRQAEGVRAHLTLSAGLARLVEDALWRGDGEALARARQLVEGQAAERGRQREGLARAGETLTH
jgi:hypothetical protein